jgi:hypothetical protein
MAQRAAEVARRRQRSGIRNGLVEKRFELSEELPRFGLKTRRRLQSTIGEFYFLVTVSVPL